MNRSQKRMSAAGIFMKKPTNRFTENPVWPHSQNRRLWKNLIAILLLVVSFPVFPYEYIDFSSPTFDEDTLLRFVEHGRVGYLDQQGRVVVEAAFEYGSYFASGRALVRVNGKYGYIDRTGQIVIPAQFDQASDFQGGVAPAGVKNPAGNSTVSGLIDLAGRWIVPPQFKQIKFAGSLLAVSRDGDLWALMFPDGRIVTEFLFAEYVGHNTDDTPEWSDRDFYERKPVLGRDIREAEGLIQYTDGGKYGFMDLRGRIVIPARFEFAHYFRGSEAVVKDGGRWGIIDRSGQYVLPPRYERLQGAGFSEGLCGVRLGGLWGFMDRSGQMIIKPQFIGVEEFSDGAAGFLFNSAYGTQTYKYGYIDRNGQTLFPPGMTAIGPFRNGRAWQVSSICSGMQAIIDKKKQPFFPDADHGTLCRMTPRTWTFSGNGPGMVVVDSTTGNQIFRIDEPVELLIPVTETIYFVLYLDSHDRVEYGYLDTRRGVIRRFVVTNREDIRRVRSM